MSRPLSHPSASTIFVIFAMFASRSFTGRRCLVQNLGRPIAPFHSSSRRARPNSTIKQIDASELESVFAKPTWSVESLLPPKHEDLSALKISSKQLHHLLRLSALPLPETPEQEKDMLDTLSAQLHFVGQIQKVDVDGVKPLRAIRDETTAAEEEQTITLETLKEALAKEKVIGKHYKRIQRDATPVDARDVEDWDVLGSAEKTCGKYFVVDSERPQE
ncbi:hypothetical protein P280DRAFT_57997 [Massarina eburnea CBS 473.64]|uniref:Glutamyl-tRNA amidotransferase complex subunit Gta3 domain-containing protein n=1 Tax=Massarina eburnea CBS 473.64 TaxID=1395130 RepID=A0A6A6RUL5_9PLEO|nr:hypothetical protein P280DRAFT_57997 [Massarina eburnea CBS 473.64]